METLERIPSTSSLLFCFESCPVTVWAAGDILCPRGKWARGMGGREWYSAWFMDPVFWALRETLGLAFTRFLIQWTIHIFRDKTLLLEIFVTCSQKPHTLKIFLENTHFGHNLITIGELPQGFFSVFLNNLFIIVIQIYWRKNS